MCYSESKKQTKTGMCHEKQDNTQNDKNICNHGPYKQDHSSNTNANKGSRTLDTIGNYSGRLRKTQRTA